MSTKLVPREGHDIYKSTVRGLQPKGQKEVSNLLNFEITATNPKNKVTRLPATVSGARDNMGAIILMSEKPTPPLKPPT